LDGVLYGLFRRGELKVGQILSQFFVARRLLELAVGLISQKLDLALKVVGVEDHPADGLDADLVLLVDRENDGLDLLVLARRPDEELGQIERVDELTEGLPRSPDFKGLALLFSQVRLVYKSFKELEILRRFLLAKK
jgi:hypothetical protein